MSKRFTSGNTASLVPVFDTERSIRSTGDMLPWYTGKACEHTEHTHINMCVFDSRREANEAFELDRNPNVRAWEKRTITWDLKLCICSAASSTSSDRIIWFG